MKQKQKMSAWQQGATAPLRQLYPEPELANNHLQIKESPGWMRLMFNLS